jgi:hypothetical protein
LAKSFGAELSKLIVDECLSGRVQGFEGDLDQGFQVAVPARVFLSFLRCANTRATDT